MKKITAADPESRSADLLAHNVGKLHELFPQAFTEGKVDFQVLRELLGDAVEEREERYGLNWHGKARARRLALTPSTGTLRPVKEKSVDWDTTQNLIIEGDNLEVLKLLQKSYAGKVKLIYIDPPYNTGRDFIYHDDYVDNVANYLVLTGQSGNDGGVLSSNTETSGRFHTDWMNMILPRLMLAKNLLTDDGVMLVSINDVEAPRLRIILDTVFGEPNFLCQFVWNNEGNIDQQSRFKGVHEYVLAYSKNAKSVSPPNVIDPNIEETSKLYNDQIENSITKNGKANPSSEVRLPVGFPATFESGELQPRSDKWPHIIEPIVVQDSVLAKPAVVYSGWSSRNLLSLFINNGCIPIRDAEGKVTWFAVTESGAIYVYKKRSEDQGHVLSVIRNVGTTKQNSGMLKRWGINFDYPKPVYLLQYLVSVFTRADAPEPIVLDFFAGSGTTADAVMRQNTADNGTRRFLLVQLPEPVEDTTEKLTIAEITRRRVVEAAQELRVPDSLFDSPDQGFRYLSLDATNFSAWDPTPTDLQTQLGEHVDHIKPDRTEDDLLYEVLLKLGIDLSVPIETRTIAGFDVHNIGAGQLLACFGMPIRRADATPLARGITAWHDESRPEAADADASTATLLFRDAAFEDDVAKQNLVHALKQAGLTNVRSL